MLTRQQARALGFIVRHAAEHGITPSFRQIAAELGVVSTSGVHRIVQALIERGMLGRTAGTARSLEVLDRAFVALGPMPEYLPAVVPERGRPNLLPLVEDLVSQLRCVLAALAYEHRQRGLTAPMVALRREVEAAVARGERTAARASS